MNVVLEKLTGYSQEFQHLQPSLPGASLAWLQQRRRDALASFEEAGFPTAKQDAWRWTPVDGIANGVFKHGGQGATVTPEQVSGHSFRGLHDFQLVFIDGVYAPHLSTVPASEGLSVLDLGSALAAPSDTLERHLAKHAAVKGNAFTALNTAFFASGAFIQARQGFQAAAPVHLLFLSDARAGSVQSHPRILVHAEQGARLSLVESYAALGTGVYWTNAVTEIVLADGAQVDHIKVQREGESAYHISTIQASLSRDSRFNSKAVLLGAAVSRNNINVTLAAEGAECELNGLYLASGRQVSDTHTWVDHAKPHGTSREFYKGILDQKAQGVFDGHVLVQANAQKTDSSQSNKNLLLSNEAKVHTKPVLKIFANDVKCKHGATIGQINADHLFYLQSRGVPKDEARKLLIYAFASEMLEQIEIQGLREGLQESLFAKFGGGR